MGDDVVFVIKLVDEDVVDHGVQKRGIGAGADPCKYVGTRGGPGESRVYMNEDGAIFLRLSDPLHRHDVVLRDIAALDEDGFTVLQIGPVIRHRTPSEGSPQTGDCWAMSK